MNDDKLNFLAGAPPEGPEDVSAPAGDAATLAESTPAASAPDDESPGGETVGAVPPPPPPGGSGQVPISALLDEREKRQAEKARAERFERELEEIRARQAPAPPPAPEEQLQAALYAQNLRTSRRFAERAYTPELVSQLHDWASARCDEDPIFNQQMRNAEDPYEAAMQAWRREQILAAIKDPAELEAFKAWQAAQAPASSAPSDVRPAVRAQPPNPPRSLATASGTGGAGAPHVPIGPGQAFGATIR
jgi:hypothetical protein